jgi:hypothetical protein
MPRLRKGRRALARVAFRIALLLIHPASSRVVPHGLGDIWGFCSPIGVDLD